MLIDLVDADLALQSLFDHHNPKDGKLLEAFDRINSRQGSASIDLVTAEAKVLGGTQQVHIGHKDIRQSGTTKLL